MRVLQAAYNLPHIISSNHGILLLQSAYETLQRVKADGFTQKA